MRRNAPVQFGKGATEKVRQEPRWCPTSSIGVPLLMRKRTGPSARMRPVNGMEQEEWPMLKGYGSWSYQARRDLLARVAPVVSCAWYNVGHFTWLTAFSGAETEEAHGNPSFR